MCPPAALRILDKVVIMAPKQQSNTEFCDAED